ncbi:MAG: Lrp/AsnC family transcriptional regulator [Candidatus Micrarchaeia archaeon]
MKGIPEKVLETFEKLKINYKHHITIRHIKKSFYIYEITSSFKKGEDKYPKNISFYLGKIKEDGTFLMAKHRKEETKVNSLDEYLKVKKSAKKESKFEKLIYLKEMDLELLTYISSNSRITIKELSNIFNVSTSLISSRLSKLENDYKIKYTIELGPRPFGFFRYFALVKFKDKIPDRDKLAELLSSNPMIQFAALTSGKYDLFLYMFAENTQKLEENIFNIRSNIIFNNCKASWIVSYITYAYGYIPIRDKFFDYIYNNFVWYRTKEEPRKPDHKLVEREYIILKELNENGRINFNKIDKKYGFSEGLSAYTYYRLVSQKIIIRPTITMKEPPIKYNTILLLKQLDIRKFLKVRSAYLLNTIQDTQTPLNKYILSGDIGAPYGILRIVPIFNDGDLTNIIKEIYMLKSDIEIKYLIITDILVGTLGYRRINNTLSTQYKILQEISNQNKDIEKYNK